MLVPLLDIKAQLKPIRHEILNAVTDVIDGTQYIMGKKVQEFEEEAARYCGTKYAVGVSSGTDALLISLMALDIKRDDLIITTPYSFFATAGAIVRVGAVPVFVDIDPVSYNISPSRLKEWFDSHPTQIKKVKAIIPVHLYGQCADMEGLIKTAQQYNIPVIEDSAQAIGAEYVLNGNTRRAGSMGELGCFSFFPSKNLGGIGDGGMVAASDSDLAEKLKTLRNHGSKPKYYHEFIGGNFRLDTIQAAVLLVKLKYLDKWHEARQKNALNYNTLFNEAKIRDIKTPTAVHQGAAKHYHIYNQYVIQASKRDELKTFLEKNGISTEVYYPLPFHLQGCFSYLGYKKGDFPESENAAEKTLAIPIYPEITDEMQRYVVSKIKEFYNKTA